MKEKLQILRGFDQRKWRTKEKTSKSGGRYRKKSELLNKIYRDLPKFQANQGFTGFFHFSPLRNEIPNTIIMQKLFFVKSRQESETGGNQYEKPLSAECF
ncbi:MAG: hypothetical protein IKQ69_09645 [Oscillospiraceae bacterium]|nr:hypothetical protein [Oscillospiraceae bacterium]